MSEVTVGKNLSSRIIAAFPYDVPLPSQVSTPVITKPEKLKQSQKTLVGQASRLLEHLVSLRVGKKKLFFQIQNL